MRVLITGSSGMIGSALAERLETEGDTVIRLVRRPPEAGEVRWDPDDGSIDAAALAGIDAAVHLAGESIGAKLRWTEEHKQRVLDSRVVGTRLLARTLASLDPKPRTLLSGSAVGFYGDRGMEFLTETCPPGTGFLAQLCVQWEATTSAAEDVGIRVVHLRSGLVLDRDEGILPRMALPARLGLGAKLGNGRQYMSWITLTDEIGAIVKLLRDDSVSGPVNLVAPQPVTNAEFTKALGRALHRPAPFAVPSKVLEMALGKETAHEMLLGGQRVHPQRLESMGFAFAHPRIDEALSSIYS